jgi:cell division protein FtsN
MKKKINNSIIFLSLFIFSCSSNEQPKIRIVDLQGNAKPISTRTPELNNQALNSQNIAVNSPSQSSHKVEVRKNSDSSNFSAFSSQAIQQTLQNQSKASQADSKMISKNTELAENNIKSDVASNMARDKGSSVEYDLSDIPEPEKTIAPDSLENKKSEDQKLEAQKVEKAKTFKFNQSKVERVKDVNITQKSSGKKFFVQVGSFTNRFNADGALQKMKKFHHGKVEVVEGEKTVYRTLLGPFPNKEKANQMLKKISRSGEEGVLVRGN